MDLDIFVCDNCESLKKDFAIKFGNLKKKIISTDLLLRKYDVKSNVQSKRLEDASLLIEQLQRDLTKCNSHLGQALQDLEPFKRDKARLEKDCALQTEQLKDLQAQLQASEKHLDQHVVQFQQLQFNNQHLADESNTFKKEACNLKKELAKAEQCDKKLERDYASAVKHIVTFGDILHSNKLLSKKLRYVLSKYAKKLRDLQEQVTRRSSSESDECVDSDCEASGSLVEQGLLLDESGKESRDACQQPVLVDVCLSPVQESRLTATGVDVCLSPMPSQPTDFLSSEMVDDLADVFISSVMPLSPLPQNHTSVKVTRVEGSPATHLQEVTASNETTEKLENWDISTNNDVVIVYVEESTNTTLDKSTQCDECLEQTVMDVLPCDAVGVIYSNRVFLSSNAGDCDEDTDRMNLDVVDSSQMISIRHDHCYAFSDSATDAFDAGVSGADEVGHCTRTATHQSTGVSSAATNIVDDDVPFTSSSAFLAGRCASACTESPVAIVGRTQDFLLSSSDALHIDKNLSDEPPSCTCAQCENIVDDELVSILPGIPDSSPSTTHFRILSPPCLRSSQLVTFSKRGRLCQSTVNGSSQSRASVAHISFMQRGSLFKKSDDSLRRDLALRSPLRAKTFQVQPRSPASVSAVDDAPLVSAARPQSPAKAQSAVRPVLREAPLSNALNVRRPTAAPGPAVQTLVKSASKRPKKSLRQKLADTLRHRNCRSGSWNSSAAPERLQAATPALSDIFTEVILPESHKRPVSPFHQSASDVVDERQARLAKRRIAHCHPSGGGVDSPRLLVEPAKALPLPSTLPTAADAEPANEVESVSAHVRVEDLSAGKDASKPVDDDDGCVGSAWSVPDFTHACSRLLALAVESKEDAADADSGKLLDKLRSLKEDTDLKELETELCELVSQDHSISFVRGLLDFVTSCEQLPLVDAISAVASTVQGNAVPVLYPMEEKCLSLIANLERHDKWNQIGEMLMDRALDELFQPKGQQRNSAALCRFYTALCRRRQQLQRARIFCYDVLFRDIESSGALLVAVLGVWPDVLLAVNYDSSCLVEVIQFVLIRHHKRLQLSESVDWLDLFRNKLSFAGKECRLEELSGKLVAIIKKNQQDLWFEASKALELLSKVEGWEWTNNFLIRKEMWPLLQSWSPDNLGSLDCVMANAVYLLGCLSRHCPPEYKASAGDIVKKLVCLLQKSFEVAISMVIQEATVLALLMLAPFDPSPVTSLLNKWLQLKGNEASPNIVRLIDKARSTFS